MLLTFDQVGEALDDLADAFPPVLFDGLNGGVNLLEDAVLDTEFPAGEMHILGEYGDDLLGKYINLYYGSFAALAKSDGWNADTWVDELRTTLAHELTHHLEALGGLHDLDDRDAAELAAWRAEYAAEADTMEEE